MTALHFSNLTVDDDFIILNALCAHVELKKKLIEKRQSYLAEGIGDQTDIDAISVYDSEIAQIITVLRKLQGRI